MTAPEPSAVLDALITAHADQLRRISADEHPGRLAMLAAAESAGGLVAAEMRLAGLPWRADVHNAMLAEMLGPRPPTLSAGGLPARLAELAARIDGAFGGRRVNPDSPAQLMKAFAADGVRITSTRSAVLRSIDHPAAEALLEYKELARLHAAHGWAWLDTWVSGGRFRPEYVVGGVVSGRWASRGGGALQIPRVLRRAVVADPGWVLVVADAAQLEPRVLAALAGDRAFAEAAASGDLYLALAGAFGGDRGKAKVALLSAMYGGGGGEAGQLLAVLRNRFPRASAYVENAARAGEEGRVVRSVLGRTCPPPSAAWRAMTEDSWDPDSAPDPGAGAASRARGRFTRNFVVQASAADWAIVLLAGLRTRLARISIDNGNSGAGPQLPARTTWWPGRTWCSSSTTRSSCTAQSRWPIRSSRRSMKPARRPAGWCSAPRRSGSRWRRRSSTATPTQNNGRPSWPRQPVRAPACPDLAGPGRTLRCGLSCRPAPVTGGTCTVQYMQRVAASGIIAEALRALTLVVISILAVLDRSLVIGTTTMK